MRLRITSTRLYWILGYVQRYDLCKSIKRVQKYTRSPLFGHFSISFPKESCSTARLLDSIKFTPRVPLKVYHKILRESTLLLTNLFLHETTVLNLRRSTLGARLVGQLFTLEIGKDLAPSHQIFCF